MSISNKFIERVDTFAKFLLEKTEKSIKLNVLKYHLESYLDDINEDYTKLKLDKDIRARDAFYKADNIYGDIEELINEKNAIKFLEKVARSQNYLLLLQKVTVINKDKLLKLYKDIRARYAFYKADIEATLRN